MSTAYMSTAKERKKKLLKLVKGTSDAHKKYLPPLIRTNSIS